MFNSGFFLKENFIKLGPSHRNDLFIKLLKNTNNTIIFRNKRLTRVWYTYLCNIGTRNRSALASYSTDYGRYAKVIESASRLFSII